MVVMLTSGVPVGSSSISQCLHPRYKGLHPRNLQVHSFCPDYSVHSRAREEEIRGEDTHTHTETRTVKWGTLGQRHVLSQTHLNTALVQSEPHLKPSALRTESDHNGGGHQSLPSAGNFKSFLSPSGRPWFRKASREGPPPLLRGPGGPFTGDQRPSCPSQSYRMSGHKAGT